MIVCGPVHRYDNKHMANIPTCKPPDPDTRRPKFRPPPGSCDAHCHIFGPGVRYPYAPDRTYTPPDAPLSRFKELQSTLGLERAVLVNASCHGTDNTVIVDAIAQSGGRYRGVANADDSFTERMFEDLHQAGFRGVRFNFVKHLGGVPDMGEFHRVIARIKPLGWHVDLHFDAADLVGYDGLLQELPVPFIIDHMARVPTKAGLEQEPFQHLLQLVRTTPTCWVKISGAERISSNGPPFTDAVPFAQALTAAAPDQILWGTDWPHPNIARHMPNDGDLVDLVPLFAPDPAIQRKILIDNPHRLYGFGDSMNTPDPFDDIPGTTLFDAQRSRQGYHLNMFCMSLMKAENRAAFKADEAAYLQKFPMTPQQRDSVLRRDWNAMIALGGNIYFLAKLFSTDGLSFQHVAALMTGSTQEQYARMMLDGGRSADGNRSKSEWKDRG